MAKNELVFRNKWTQTWIGCRLRHGTDLGEKRHLVEQFVEAPEGVAVAAGVDGQQPPGLLHPALQHQAVHLQEGNTHGFCCLSSVRHPNVPINSSLLSRSCCALFRARACAQIPSRRPNNLVQRFQLYLLAPTHIHARTHNTHTYSVSIGLAVLRLLQPQPSQSHTHTHTHTHTHSYTHTHTHTHSVPVGGVVLRLLQLQRCARRLVRLDEVPAQPLKQLRQNDATCAKTPATRHDNGPEKNRSHINPDKQEEKETHRQRDRIEK